MPISPVQTALANTQRALLGLTDIKARGREQDARNVLATARLGLEGARTQSAAELARINAERTVRREGADIAYRKDAQAFRDKAAERTADYRAEMLAETVGRDKYSRERLKATDTEKKRMSERGMLSDFYSEFLEEAGIKKGSDEYKKRTLEYSNLLGENWYMLTTRGDAMNAMKYAVEKARRNDPRVQRVEWLNSYEGKQAVSDMDGMIKNGVNPNSPNAKALKAQFARRGFFMNSSRLLGKDELGDPQTTGYFYSIDPMPNDAADMALAQQFTIDHPEWQGRSDTPEGRAAFDAYVAGTPRADIQNPIIPQDGIGGPLQYLRNQPLAPPGDQRQYGGKATPLPEVFTQPTGTAGPATAGPVDRVQEQMQGGVTGGVTPSAISEGKNVYPGPISYLREGGGGAPRFIKETTQRGGRFRPYGTPAGVDISGDVIGAAGAATKFAGSAALGTARAGTRSAGFVLDRVIPQFRQSLNDDGKRAFDAFVNLRLPSNQNTEGLVEDFKQYMGWGQSIKQR